MVLPPPNVTGNLHIGHAVTATIEDAICRYQEKLGKKVRSREISLSRINSLNISVGLAALANMATMQMESSELGEHLSHSI